MNIHDFVMRPRNLTLPFRTNRLFKVLRWSSADSAEFRAGENTVEETTDLNEADIVSSQIRDYGEDYDNTHTVVLDIDVPAMLVPSSTPGKHHLYIDVPMNWEIYVNLLDAMADAGVVEKGYVSASKERGFTAVRLPWVRKLCGR